MCNVLKWILYATLGSVLLSLQADEALDGQVSRHEARANNPSASLASILNAKPDPKKYRNRKHCISKLAIRDHKILSKRHIVFTMRGQEREKILVQFGRHCAGLERYSVLNLESEGSARLCVGDHVRTETFEFGRRSWGARCTIPTFELITDYQMELLQEALLTGRVE